MAERVNAALGAMVMGCLEKVRVAPLKSPLNSAKEEPVMAMPAAPMNAPPKKVQEPEAMMMPGLMPLAVAPGPV